MAATTSSGMLVWRRNLERRSRTWVWWVIGFLVALSAFGAFAAYMADDTAQIPTFVGLGVVGSLFVWLIPPVYDWGRRRNPEIRIEGRELCWAKVRVPIDQVDRWSAGISTQMFFNGTTASRGTIGIVTFRMFDGAEKRFTFAHLGEDELVSLMAALDPILPGRRVD